MAKNIKEAFASQLASGKVIITDILDTKNPDQKRIEIAQLVKSDKPNLIGILQNIPQQTVLVAWMPVLKTELEARKFEVGGNLDKFIADQLQGFSTNIEVKESTEPTTWLEDGRFVRVNRTAKMNKSGDDAKYLLSEGNYIFRQTSLVVGKPNHIKIQHDEITAEAPNYDVIEAALQEQVQETIMN